MKLENLNGENQLSLFERIKKIDDLGNEYWSSRELS
jgi:hypothetical protein